jgi:hypothetical protein
MVDWNKKFKPEYDYARTWLANEVNFEESWRPLVKGLYKLMATTGFDDGEADRLVELRKFVTHGEKQVVGYKKVGEDQGILTAVGGWTTNGGGNLDPNIKMRAAALKLLRHTYLLNKSGNRKVWIVSLPKVFTDWPSDYMHANIGTEISARVLLRNKEEHFSDQQKKDLAAATRMSLAWCQKTNAVLAAAAAASKSSSKANTAALNLFKRWFADPGASITDINKYIANIAKGFKDITAMINKGSMILTDWVPFRAATAQDEIDFLNAEAFTFRGSLEGLDVVYIESNFFVDNPGNVLKGQKNWTRIIVHELTHLVASTLDVVNGQARYAWYGIGPHAGYPASQAVTNADNWAFFCADCGGVLTESERNTALKIV